jgi:hypothetical protein
MSTEWNSTPAPASGSFFTVAQRVPPVDNGVVIGFGHVIGDHCRIYQGVTLGAKSFPKDKQSKLTRDAKRSRRGKITSPSSQAPPSSAAFATIGPGSVINGGVFLTNSVPPGHTSPRAQVGVDDAEQSRSPA